MDGIFKYDHLEMARIIGEPVDPRRRYPDVISKICEIDRADPNEYVYQFDVLFDTDVIYTITEADTSSVVYAKTYELLVAGVIQIKVYDNVKDNISTIYKQKQFNSDERDWQDLMNSMFLYSYYNSLLTQEDDAKRSEKLEMLYFLEQKLNN